MPRAKKNPTENLNNAGLPVRESSINDEAFLSVSEVVNNNFQNECVVLTNEELMKEPGASYVQVVKTDKKHSHQIVRFDPNPQEGLSSRVVNTRIATGLKNSRPQGSTKKVYQIILSNLITFFNIITALIAVWILASAGVEGLTQCFFLVIVGINTGISIFQEIRSKMVIDKLSIVSQPTTIVIRDGAKVEVAIDTIVLDDIISLSTGKQIVTDSVVVDGQIEVNESLLTGESDSIIKKKGDVLYAGSYVVSGNCCARVEHVGKDNYIDRLSHQAQKYRKPKSELMKTLKIIIIVCASVIIPLGVGVFLRQWDSEGLGTMTYLEAISTAAGIRVVTTTAGAMIGMIPSGLFLCTSIALAVGAVKLAKNNTLVQELNCIEMLARADVLCLDKTGTITDGTMCVKNVIEYPNDSGLSIKNAFAAMQNVLDSENMTAKAVEAMFGRGKRLEYISKIPFNSQRKYSAVEFEGYGTFAMGAPEFILTKNFGKVATDVNKAASKGFRVLLLAYSKTPIKAGKISGNFEPLALVIIEDTIRPDAVETIDYFKKSGVNVKVISGDNPLTVSKISLRAGITDADKYISLEGLSDVEVERVADKYTVFGRVSPNQKKILVQALQHKGHTVAMTGDGVNDILALREADCSIAIASGSEAARNVSHLVLLDSNFSSMPKVVSEGRRVINNVQKVASLFLTKTIFSFLLALYCCITPNSTYPIEPIQLAIIELCVIGIPSFVLALEPNNEQFKGKFISNVIKNALPGAIVIVINTILIFAISGFLNLNAFQDAAASFRLSSNYETNTIIILVATYTSFIVLYEVCKPFNSLRRALFGFVAVLAVFAALFLFYQPFHFVQIIPNIFSDLEGYPRISTSGFLLMICLIQAAYPLLYIIKHLRPWTKNLLEKIGNLINKIH